MDAPAPHVVTSTLYILDCFAMSREHVIGVHLQDDHSSYYKWVPAWTAHLLMISRCHNRPPSFSYTLIPETWRMLLAGHPNRQLVDFFISGISQGFCIGFKHLEKPFKSVRRNLSCALDHPETVTQFLADKIAQHRVAGVHLKNPLSPVYTSESSQRATSPTNGA